MKNIFKRMTDIFTANINALIDQAEDPEKMIQQIVREMEENICKARRSAAEAIASEKKLEKQLMHTETDIAKWHLRAENSLKNNNEEMARTALTQKRDYEKTAEALTESLRGAALISNRLKLQIRQMGAKLEEIKRKAVSLKIRQRAAEARERINMSVCTIQNTESLQYEFNRMEAQVIDMESMVEAMTELDSERDLLASDFEVMERDFEVEEELCALKEKINA